MQVALTGVGNAIFTKHGGVVAGNPKPSRNRNLQVTALNIAVERLGMSKAGASEAKEEFNKYMDGRKSLASNIFHRKISLIDNCK